MRPLPEATLRNKKGRDLLAIAAFRFNPLAYQVLVTINEIVRP
jgi:hypothetical protein